MTKEELAKRLTGREYGNEIRPVEEKLARQAGLVVVFGYSDDNVELRGAIHDEIGCYDGGSVDLTADGVLLPWDRIDHDSEAECARYFEHKLGKVVTLECLWCKEGAYSWTYKLPLPHATFEIVEDGKPFCRGVIFDAKELES